MLNMNRATLLGHAGRDPEIRDLAKGERAASFTLATTERWTGKDGRPGEATEWHRVVVYGAAVTTVGIDAEEGRRGAGRGPDRDSQRTGTRKVKDKDGHRDRGRRPAGNGQRPVAEARGGRRMIRALALAALLASWGGAVCGAGLHRTLRQPGLRRLLGVPVPGLHRADFTMGSASGAPDTPNPSSPICLCGSPFPRIGLSLGVWEPARLVDATRAPWCFPNLGGLTIDPGLPAGRGRTGSSGGDGATGSVWHAHHYVYPLLSWIGALLDLGCLEAGGLDIAWVSELDPAWLDDELSFLLNPEAALFANLPAQAACAADCAAASAGLPVDRLFWCAGCQGGMYPDDRQRRGARGRRPGVAARGPAAAVPAAPRRDRVGHLRLRARSAGATRCR